MKISIGKIIEIIVNAIKYIVLIAFYTIVGLMRLLGVIVGVGFVITIVFALLYMIGVLASELLYFLLNQINMLF